MDLGKRCMYTTDLQKSCIVRYGEISSVSSIYLCIATSITLMKLEDEVRNHRLHPLAWERQIRATRSDYLEAKEGEGFRQ